MKRLLIAYVSHSGSTREIAQFLSDELSTRGFTVDMLPLAEISDLTPYEFIIAGGLLYRFGWHPDILRFLERNLPELQKKQVALFVTGMHLIKTPRCDQLSYPVFIDPAMANPVWARPNPTIFDGGSTIDGYLRLALSTIEQIKPVCLGFFAGKLDLRTLKLPEQMIMRILMLLTGMKTGDYRNWDALHAWGQRLFSMGDTGQ
jgi:menaquinone-dependent protoporphyrinogen oxidase